MRSRSALLVVMSFFGAACCSEPKETESERNQREIKALLEKIDELKRDLEAKYPELMETRYNPTNTPGSHFMTKKAVEKWQDAAGIKARGTDVRCLQEELNKKENK